MPDKRPLLYDLFCGGGGAGMGYHRAGFEVIGVDNKPQRNYPFEFIQMDALEFLQEVMGGEKPKPDMIHASPPCQRWVDPNRGRYDDVHPDLIKPCRALFKYLFRYLNITSIIENVDSAPLEDPITLCGSMFDLLLRRHRLFEIHPYSPITPPLCNHWGKASEGDIAVVVAFGARGPRRGRDANGHRVRDGKPTKEGPAWEAAMGINWMTRKELTQAIPPAYTEFIGKQLIERITT